MFLIAYNTLNWPDVFLLLILPKTCVCRLPSAFCLEKSAVIGCFCVIPDRLNFTKSKIWEVSHRGKQRIIF